LRSRQPDDAANLIPLVAMRRGLLILSLPLAACSSSPTSQPLPTVGAWQYIAPGVGQPSGPGLEWAWTGSRLFALGRAKAWQSDSDATLLDPDTGVWTPASAVGAPSPRAYGFTAWTGAEVFVWSGESNGDLADGGLYNPATDSWRQLPAAPIAPRHLGTAVWSGSVVIVWGGQSHDSANNIVTFNDGAKFDPVAGEWSLVSTSGGPRAMSQHAAVWTGSRMIVWDGVIDGGAAAYDPVSDAWTPISTVGAPSPRNFPAAVWTGTDMIVLAGQCVGSYCRDGGRYDPATDTWKLFNIPAPSGYITGSSAAWNGHQLMTWGWVSSGRGWGGIYDPQADSWKQMAAAPTELVGRAPEIVVWTGSSAIVYGGQINGSSFADGAVFTP
jgi:N-acetylneuraminic acid mutarotase